MERQELNATVSISLLYVVRMLGLFMVLPVLPLLVDEIADSTPFLIGLALGVYGLSQALLQIPLGILSDIIGRKPVLLAGLLVFVAGSLVAASSENIYGIIAGRFLQGCGAIASTLLALLSDVTQTENRSKAMAIVGMSIGASFGISLVLGPWVNNLFGLEGIFLGTALAGLVGIAILYLLVPTPEKMNLSLDSHLEVTRLSEVISHSGLVKTILGIFILHFLLMSSFVAFPVLMQGTGEVESSDHHLVYLSILVVTFVFMVPFMWLSDKPHWVKPLMLMMIGFFISSSFLLSRFITFYPVMASMLMFFMAFNLLEVVLPSIVSKLAPAGSRGTAMGVYSTAQFAGAFVGGAVGGYIAGAWQISDLMYVNIAVCLVWFMVSLSIPKTGNVQTLTYSLTGIDQPGAKKVRDALLSIEGVNEAVIIESEQIAYLKVDDNLLDKEALDQLKKRSESEQL